MNNKLKYKFEVSEAFAIDVIRKMLSDDISDKKELLEKLNSKYGLVLSDILTLIEVIMSDEEFTKDLMMRAVTLGLNSN